MSETLEKINGRIAVLKSQIGKLESQTAARKTELGELETAVKVILRIGGEVAATPPDATANDDNREQQLAIQQNAAGDLVGKTVKECARIILKEEGRPLHFEEIYNRAVARGYSSGRADGGVAQTFWAMLKRDTTGEFEAPGGGKFGLVQHGGQNGQTLSQAG